MKARGVQHARLSLPLLRLRRPVRAWALFVFHNPGRCPGLGLLRPVGARLQIGQQLGCRITSPPSTRGRVYCRDLLGVGVGGEKSDFKNRGADTRPSRRFFTAEENFVREFRDQVDRIAEGRQDPITKFCQINGMGLIGEYLSRVFFSPYPSDLGRPLGQRRHACCGYALRLGLLPHPVGQKGCGSKERSASTPWRRALV